MASTNQYPGINPHIVTCVRHHARRIIGRIPGMELEDLEQELMLQAHRRLNAYNPERAQLRTFLDRVLRNLCSHLLEAAGARRRKPDRPLLSLSWPRPPADGRDGGPELDFNEDAGSELDWCERAHLRHDLERMLVTLPEHLTECCRWLIQGTTTDAAHHTGLARGTIHSRIVTMRRRFAAAGLSTYLAAPARQF
jgi:RNA polymerase sigma factor (sigma-70 family)